MIIEGIRDRQNYLNKQVLMQIIYFFKSIDFQLVKNFKTFSKKMKNSFRSKDVIWNVFDSDRVSVEKGDEP